MSRPSTPLLSLALGLTAALLGASEAHAGVPGEVGVQARLTSTGGSPVTSPTTVTLRIHDLAVGGSTLHSETDLVMPDAAGLFFTRLGDGPALPPGVFSAPRWLSLEVWSEGEAGPRIPFVPVPYALRARSARRFHPTTTVDLLGERLTGLAAPASADGAATRAFADAGDAAFQAALAAHTGDASVHFPVASLTVASTQVAGLDGAITGSAHALDGAVHYPAGSITLASTQVVDLDAAVDLSTHAQDAAVHFSQASITLTSTQVVDLDAAVTASAHGQDAANPHGVTAAQVGLGDVADLKHATAATRPPDATDDAGAGFAVGSRWVDTHGRRSHVLIDLPGPGQARWRATTPGRTVLHVPAVFTGGVQDPVASGQALEATMAGITDSSASRRYLVRVDPGVFQLSGALTLERYVTLEGEGRDLTFLVEGHLRVTTWNEIRDVGLFPASGAPGGIVLSGDETLIADGVRIERPAATVLEAAGIVAENDDNLIVLRRSEILVAGTNNPKGILHDWGSGFGNRSEIRDSVIEVTSSNSKVVGIDAPRGNVEILRSRIEVEASAAVEAYGLEAIHANTSSVRILDSDLSVESQDLAEGIRVQSGGLEVHGSTFFVRGKGITAIVVLEGPSYLSGNRLLIEGIAGATGPDGVTSSSDSGRAIAEGNVVELSGPCVGGLARGIHVLDKFSSLVRGTGNLVTSGPAGLTVDGCTIDGLRVSPGGTYMGNTVDLELTGTNSSIRGLVFERGTEPSASSGNRIRLSRTSGGKCQGLRVESLAEPSALSGDLIEVDCAGQENHGIWMNGDRASVSGVDVRVTGTSQTHGALMDPHDLSSVDLVGSYFQVNGDGADVVGIEADHDALIAGVEVEVTNASATADATGLDCETGADACLVKAARITVTDGGTGTSYAVDGSDDATASPDARVDGSHFTAEDAGADVICTDSKCL